MEKIKMLGTDGTIKEIPLYLKDAMLLQGWKVVSPDVADDLMKKGITYLPQFDQTISKPKNPDYSMLDPNTPTNTLDIEVL